MNLIKQYLVKTKFYIFLSHCKNRKRKIERNAYFKAEGADILHHFSECMNQNGIPFWLDFGSLLGYYRDHDFISHDFDLDFSTRLENANKVRETLLNAGFKLIKEYHVKDSDGLEECYKWGHTSLDVFYYKDSTEDGYLYCYSFRHFDRVKNKDIGKVVPVGVSIVTVPFSGLSKVQFKDCDVFIPKNTEEYLVANYGSDYMIPNPHFDWMKDATNIAIFPYEEMPGWALFYEII